ncbi:hypothetical protein [Streptomyces sp. MB09-02B]|uniref:hypothetical protein n=1 Tax=Streptomyces sp. MB09-02B TaxID=3028667 RepID=UPI0029B542CD|nr:hypothetical protein [Streptomyces sp. MB09-02B]MDX3646244.1 hypothetical protein [Streptomyces sp. MB09-02B]
MRADLTAKKPLRLPLLTGGAARQDRCAALAGQWYAAPAGQRDEPAPGATRPTRPALCASSRHRKPPGPSHRSEADAHTAPPPHNHRGRRPRPRTSLDPHRTG